MLTPAELDLINAMMEGVDLDAGLPATARMFDVVLDDVSLAVAEITPPGEYRGIALLIPGFTSARGTFYPIFQKLADQGFRVISFSQRGQPGSTGSGNVDDYALAALGNDVHKLLDALEIGDGVHLLGHSFGGVVGTEALVQNPNRFASFTLWNSGLSSLGENMVQARDLLRAHGHRGLWIADATEAGIDPDKDRRGELDAFEVFHYTRLMRTNQAQLDAGLTHLHEHTDRTEEIAATGVRTLISHGAYDDAWPMDSQREAAERLNADYWVVARAGHSAHADRPDVSARLLASFWLTN